MATRYGNLTLQIKELSDLSTIDTYTDSVVNAQGTEKLNALSSGSFSFPRNRTLYNDVLSNIGKLAYIYVTDNVRGSTVGLCTVYIEDIDTVVTENGIDVVVKGPGHDEQLTFSNLLDDTIDDGAGGRDTSSIASIMAYASTGWTHNGTETTKGTYHVSRGDTVLQTLISATKQSGQFFRVSSYTPPTKQVEWRQTSDSSGVTLYLPSNPIVHDGSTTVGVILSLSESRTFARTLSGVRPFGTGLEDGRLTIEEADGYTGGDPSGYSTNFTDNTIINTSLETSLGYEKREDIDFPHIKVEDPTNPAHVRTAAVALWDEAIYELQQRDTTRRFYSVSCIVPVDLRPGQTIVLNYTEYEGGQSGGSATFSPSGTYKIHDVTNRWDPNKQVRITNLVLSDDLIPRPDYVHYIRAVAEKVQGTTRKTNVSTAPGSVSTDRTFTATAPLRIDGGNTGDLSANRTFSLGTLSGFGVANQVIGIVNAGGDVEYKTLVNGTGISITHGVGTITITSTVSGAPTDAQYVTLAVNGSLSQERVLTQGDGIDITDGGAGGNVTLVVDLATNSGLTFSTGDLAMGTPSTITGSTTNNVSGSTHTHLLTANHSDLNNIGANNHHNQQHDIEGSDHTASGLTAGQVLRASGTTTFAFAAIQDSDLPSTIARDSELHDAATPGDGIDITGQQIAVDVTDIIDTSYGLTESANNIRIDLATNSGLNFSSGDLALGTPSDITDTSTNSVSGANHAHALAISDFINTSYGLEVVSNNIRVDLATNSGLTFSGGDLALGTPSDISAASANSVSGDTHTHVADASDAPGAAISLLQTTSNGGIVLRRLSVGAGGYSPEDGAIELRASGASGSGILQHREPASATDELMWRAESSGRVAYVRASPGATPPSAIVANFQAFFTNYYADGTNYESMEMAADNSNNVGWLRTTSNGTGTTHPIAVTSGGTLTDGLYIDTNGRISCGTTADGGYKFRITSDINPVLFLDTTSASGSPYVAFGQNGTRRSYIQHNDTNDDLILNSEVGDISFHANGSRRGRFGSGGTFYVNETTNGNMQIGITINQGANDNEVFSLKSSDINHGITGTTETDTYFFIKKLVGGTGGARVDGIGEYQVGLALQAKAATSATGRNSSGTAPIYVNAHKKSGTGVVAWGTGDNVFNVKNAGTNLAIFGGDGDLYLDTVVMEDHWDDYNDIALLDGLRASMVPDGHELKKRFGQFIDSAKEVLEKTGVVTYNSDGHHFVAVKKLQMLTIDAIRQKHHNDVQERSQLKNTLDAALHLIEQQQQQIEVLTTRVNMLAG